MNKRIYLSEKNRKLGGVCGGVGEYFDIDPTIVRIVWFLSIFPTSGLTLLAYFIAWIVMPKESCSGSNW